MRRTTAISLVCAAILLGLIAGRLGWSSSLMVVGLSIAGIALSWRSRFVVITICLLAISLAMLRVGYYQVERSTITQLIGEKVVLTGTVTDDPATTAKGTSFTISDLKTPQGVLPGSISVYLYPVRVQRGHVVRVEGVLKTGYGSLPASMSYPKFTVISTSQSSLEEFRQKFFAGMRTALPEPLASFGLGLLVGVRALIPKDLQAQLSLVGLSHLVAVSGYNLTILIVASQKALSRFGRGISLVGSFWLIGLFLAVAGASPSIVRASLVAVFALLASVYGRKFNPVTLILLAAAITATINPMYLSDLGWLLSFLAFFGILVLAPAVAIRFGSPTWLLPNLFIDSFCAQLMTIPLIVYIFGQLSIVSPLTNLIILPLVPLAMLLSFIAGLAGMLIPAFCGWFAWPAYLLLGFMLDVIHWFASQPWAASTQHISLTMMLGMYVCIVALTYALIASNKREGRVERKRPLPMTSETAITTS